MSGVYSYSGSGYLPMTPGGGAPLSGLGALDMTAVGYEAATVLGAAAGGGLVGYVAAKSKQGVFRGAAFSSGLALLADGVGAWKESAKGKAAVLGILGVLAAGWSVRDVMKKKRR
jgi:hypothetical protein